MISLRTHKSGRSLSLLSPQNNLDRDSVRMSGAWILGKTIVHAIQRLNKSDPSSLKQSMLEAPTSPRRVLSHLHAGESYHRHRMDLIITTASPSLKKKVVTNACRAVFVHFSPLMKTTVRMLHFFHVG